MSLALAPRTSGSVERVCRGTGRIVYGGCGRWEVAPVKREVFTASLVLWQADCDCEGCPELGVEYHEGQRYHDQEAEVRHARNLGARGGPAHEGRGCRRPPGRRPRRLGPPDR